MASVADEMSMWTVIVLLEEPAAMWSSKEPGWGFDAYASLALSQSRVLLNPVPETAIHGLLECLRYSHMAVYLTPFHGLALLEHNLLFEFQLHCPRWVLMHHPCLLGCLCTFSKDPEMVRLAQTQTGDFAIALHDPLEMMHRISVPENALSRLASDLCADSPHVP